MQTISPLTPPSSDNSELIIIDQDPAFQTKASSSQSEFFEAFVRMIPRSAIMNTSSKVAFYRLLATMVNAGIPLMRSLSILEKQEKVKKRKELIASVLGSIRQ